MGLRQVAPFRMAREPRWGARGILQLNWVFDEFFVVPGVWSSIFQSRGIASRPVMGVRDEPLKSVVQLAIGDEIEVATDGLDSSVCHRCRHKRYSIPLVGFAPRVLASSESPSLVKSRQWFGNGSRAFRLVFARQDLRRAVLSEQVRGASFRPCA